LGLEIGDTTKVQASEERGGKSREVTIVGTGVIPVDAQVFEVASGMTYDGLTSLFRSPGAEPLEAEVVVVDLADGLDVGALNAQLMSKGAIADELIRADRPGFASQLIAGLTIESVADVPNVLAVLAALLAAGVLAHLLVARRREWRRELAMHRAIGFTRGGVRAAVSTGAALVALLAAAIGVPLGVIVGRRAWLLYAESLGVKPEAAIPWGWLAVVASGVVVVAVACVLVAGALDRRPVAEALRAE
jgi:putative ABC transport system permease protein